MNPGGSQTIVFWIARDVAAVLSSYAIGLFFAHLVIALSKTLNRRRTLLYQNFFSSSGKQLAPNRKARFDQGSMFENVFLCWRNQKTCRARPRARMSFLLEKSSLNWADHF